MAKTEAQKPQRTKTVLEVVEEQRSTKTKKPAPTTAYASVPDLRVPVSPRASGFLRSLVATELYGDTDEAVARHLIYDGIRRIFGSRIVLS